MNNDNELNSISLGNVDNSQNNGVPPVDSNVEALNMPEENNNVAPVPPAMDNAPVEPIQPELQPVEPVAPISYDVPEVINNNNESPFMNEIGTVPPINNIPGNPTPAPTTEPVSEPPRKKTNKLIFVIIIVLALAAVGVGVYIFLNLAKNKAPLVTIKNVQIELGSEISTNIDDYAFFRNVDKATCSLDTTNLKSDILDAQYNFTINCRDMGNYRGTVTVVDTTKPEVVTKDLEIGVNGTVIAENFIESCDDASECSYSFQDEEKVKEDITKAGEYEIEISVKDKANNEVIVKAKLTVSENVAKIYLNCSKTTDDYSVVTKYGLNENEFNNEISYKDITGTYEFNDTDKTLKITKTMTYEELTTEAGSEIPTSAGDLRDFYGARGESCMIGY